MTILNVLALSLFLSLPSPPGPAIERAFLQNSAEILGELVTASGDIPVSLPEPLSRADLVSREQAVLVFKQIFSVFKTSEFFLDPVFSTLAGSPGGILKARWSFMNQRTGNQYPFRIFFYVAPERETRGAAGGRPVLELKIVEIRAERL